MHFPQLILMALLGVGLGAAAIKHGESRGNWNFNSVLFGFVIEVSLLYWGGFFDGVKS